MSEEFALDDAKEKKQDKHYRLKTGLNRLKLLVACVVFAGSVALAVAIIVEHRSNRPETLYCSLPEIESQTRAQNNDQEKLYLLQLEIYEERMRQIEEEIARIEADPQANKFASFTLDGEKRRLEKPAPPTQLDPERFFNICLVRASNFHEREKVAYPLALGALLLPVPTFLIFWWLCIKLAVFTWQGATRLTRWLFVMDEN